MFVAVGMRLGNRVVMLVLMVFVVKVKMLMKDDVVRVRMAVPLTKEDNHPDEHE